MAQPIPHRAQPEVLGETKAWPAGESRFEVLKSLVQVLVQGTNEQLEHPNSLAGPQHAGRGGGLRGAWETARVL